MYTYSHWVHILLRCPKCYFSFNLLHLYKYMNMTHICFRLEVFLFSNVLINFQFWENLAKNLKNSQSLGDSHWTRLPYDLTKITNWPNNHARLLYRREVSYPTMLRLHEVHSMELSLPTRYTAVFTVNTDDFSDHYYYML